MRIPPKFSVIMPVFNAANYLANAVLSIQNQFEKSWELIIVDDCSTDQSFTLARNMSETDDRIKVLRNTVNSGAAISRNIGINAAIGDYVAFLDADDCWYPNKLSDALSAHETNNRAPLVAMAYQRRGFSNGNLLGVITPPARIRWKDVLGGSRIGCLTVSINRKVVGHFAFPNKRHEDMLLWSDLLYRFGAGVGLPQVGAVYSVNPRSLSGDKRRAFSWYLNGLFSLDWLTPTQRIFLIIRYIIYHVRKLLTELKWQIKRRHLEN